MESTDESWDGGGVCPNGDDEAVEISFWESSLFVNDILNMSSMSEFPEDRHEASSDT